MSTVTDNTAFKSLSYNSKMCWLNCHQVQGIDELSQWFAGSPNLKRSSIFLSQVSFVH
jgi:hypothetical protein